MLALAAALLLQVEDLKHMDPEVRVGAVKTIGGKRIVSAIPDLIEVLKEEPNENVRSACSDALFRLTQKNFGASYADWRRWWETEGRAQFPKQVLTSDQAHQLVAPYLADLRDRVDKAKSDIRFIAISSGVLIIVFFLIMLFFVGHVSSRIKAWKELVNKAEVYVTKSEEITKRTDRIISELEAKKTDIMAFFAKVREDSQGEMDRYGDMLQKNLEHAMREEIMGLRQKAEKELQQTLGELRASVEVEVRRMAADQKEKGEKAFQDQRERFLKEVEVHTLFLEASFYSIHGKPEEALRRYRQLVANKPEHVQAWTNLGTVYRELARYDESLEAYQKALELSPNSPAVLYHLAATYARLRKRDKMLESLTRAIANDGEFKDEALNDPAFRDYWNDAAFKDIAEG